MTVLINITWRLNLGRSKSVEIPSSSCYDFRREPRLSRASTPWQLLPPWHSIDAPIVNDLEY